MSAMPVDPMALKELLWPDVTFYREQRDIIYSVADNEETDVVAGNMLGKDFVTAFIALWAFLSRTPCRVVTTSVDESQLDGVLWGEIRRFIQTSKYPLDAAQGGPLLINHLHLRKKLKKGVCGISYMIGRVAARGEGMLGHHVADIGDGVPRTFLIGDEASGLDDIVHERGDTWANRKLFIGNPYPCNNFFKKAVKDGSDYNDDTGNYYRKVIRIRAEDSPNVKYAMAELKAGKKPSNTVILPGVLSYPKYITRRKKWDKARQTVSLDAMFYEGHEIMLYPPDWLARANRIADQLVSKGTKRIARAVGVDPAEGGDKTAMSAVDEFGLIECVAYKTPDTGVISGNVIAFSRKHGIVDWQNVMFDRGGGGKQHADAMRRDGFNVRTVGFGESVSPPLQRRVNLPFRVKLETKEDKDVYKNRRAEMYGEIRELISPQNDHGYGIPAWCDEVLTQMLPIPLLRDKEGAMRIPSKNKNTENSNEKTLIEIIGHSPDELDSFAIAVHCMLHKPITTKVGAL